MQSFVRIFLSVSYKGYRSLVCLVLFIVNIGIKVAIKFFVLKISGHSRAFAQIGKIAGAEIDGVQGQQKGHRLFLFAEVMALGIKFG